MSTVTLILPSLFIPTQLAAMGASELMSNSLKKMLARGRSRATPENSQLEAHLCKIFSVPVQEDLPIAAITAKADGLPDGYWLRADPVNLTLRRDRLVLLEVGVSQDEARHCCEELNAHFAAQGLEFVAPHPQRWYVRLPECPHIRTTPIQQMHGQNVKNQLPRGPEAPLWHQIFNEVQMLLHSLPINKAREDEGEATINSVWFWGAGHTPAALCVPAERISSDLGLVADFAAAAGVPFTPWEPHWDGADLLVWNAPHYALQQGNLEHWRALLRDFEQNYAHPLWQAISNGSIDRLHIDILDRDNPRHIELTRGDAWAFWRR